MSKNKNKKTSSSNQISQDMWNNLINTDSPTGSSSAQSNSPCPSQPSGFAHYVPLLTNPYSQPFYQQHPQEAFYQPQQQQQYSHPQQQQQYSQSQQQQHYSQPPPYYTNLLNQHTSNPYQQMQPDIQDSSDDTTENTHVGECVPETQPETELDPKGKRKQVRWTAEETRILCERWIHCSENGVIGRNQTDKSFWKKVVHDYNEAVSDKRNYSQLNGKWNKIAPDVKKFNALHKHYSEVRPQSGASDNDVLIATRNHFAQNENGRKFIYEACWNILKHYPKFFQEKGVMGNKRTFEPEPQPIDLEAETGTNVQPATSNLEVNMHNLFRPDPIRRPPGRKAHKKSSSSDAATSSRSASTEKSEAYETVKRSALAHTEAIHTIKENSTKKLAFKALKFLTFQKKQTKKEKELLRNARANVVEEYGPMFPPRAPGPNDEDEAEADDEESGSD